MNGQGRQDSGYDQAMLDQLKQAVMDNPQDPDQLDQYYRQAVAQNRIDSAKTTIAQLQNQLPWNHQLRRIYIALCLQQKDYVGAMKEVEKLVAFSTPDDALIDSALSVRKYLGPRNLSDQLQTDPTLSLCFIVRNEQAFLGPCLNAIKSLADEIIVIDTGSVDRSVDIARIFGALVYDFKWCDDFSAARNAALEKAHGDWILILDADEIIAPQDHAALKRIVADAVEKPKAYSFQTRNYSNLTNAMDWQANDHSYPEQEAGIGWFPSNKVRMFPRFANIRFTYPVHELVDPSIRQAGLTIVKCPIPVHHYGHINEAKNARKARHYFNLGYAKLDQLGDDKAALRELAAQAGQLGRWSEAIELWHRFMEISAEHGEAYANIAGAYWQMGQYEQGIVFSKKAIDTSPEIREGHYNLALNLLMTGQPQEATAVLQNLLKKDRHYLAADFMLAAALSAVGEQKQSRSIFSALEKEIPGPVLAMAVQELEKKFIESGLHRYADLLGSGFE